MSALRCSTWLRMFVLGLLCAMPLACMEIAVSKSQVIVAPSYEMCPVGSAGCPCTSGGGCDPGLYCSAGVCVGDGGGDEYMFEDELMIEAPPEPVSRSSGRRADRFERRAAKAPAPAAAEADFAAGSYGPEPESVDASAGLVSGSSTSQDPAAPVDQVRQVIYTAGVHVSVYDLDAAAEFVESLPERYGGWIGERYDYQITVRITAAHLFEAIEQLSTLGLVLGKTLYAQDVTAEYVDLESRIRVLEQLVTHLEAMLKMAKTVEEMLTIRVALDRARLELASARARMRELTESIDFSTLTVLLTQRGPIDELPSSNDPFPWVDELGVEITAYR